MLRSIFGGKTIPRFTKTFTYYVPAPPARKTGYHEKEFDTVFEHVIKLGFQLLDIRTQSHSTAESSGTWVFCILGTDSQAVFEQKIEIDFMDIANTNSPEPLSPDIIHES